jgi:hypothetical protein
MINAKKITIAGLAGGSLFLVLPSFLNIIMNMVTPYDVTPSSTMQARSDILSCCYSSLTRSSLPLHRKLYSNSQETTCGELWPELD